MGVCKKSKNTTDWHKNLASETLKNKCHGEIEIFSMFTEGQVENVRNKKHVLSLVNSLEKECLI